MSNEKVKVTPKLANLIKNTLDKYPKDQIVRNYDSIGCAYRKEIDLDTLIRALYIGYEVELDYKANDWVVVNNHGDIWTAKIAKITHDEIAVYVDECPYVDNKQYYVFSKLRHATHEEIQQEKERRWWTRNGRNVWELKKGDLLSRNNVSYTVWEVHEDEVIFNEFGIAKTWEELRNNFKVASFVKDRLDTP